MNEQDWEFSTCQTVSQFSSHVNYKIKFSTLTPLTSLFHFVSFVLRDNQAWLCGQRLIFTRFFLLIVNRTNINKRDTLCVQRIFCVKRFQKDNPRISLQKICGHTFVKKQIRWTRNDIWKVKYTRIQAGSTWTREKGAEPWIFRGHK